MRNILIAVPLLLLVIWLGAIFRAVPPDIRRELGCCLLVVGILNLLFAPRFTRLVLKPGAKTRFSLKNTMGESRVLFFYRGLGVLLAVAGLVFWCVAR